VTDAAGALLGTLAARPRPAGGAAEAVARAECARRLSALGFHVTEELFEYSALPGRYATSLAGLLSIGALAAAGYAGSSGADGGRTALAILAAVAALVGVGGWWLARRGVLTAPLVRRRAVNLTAARGDPRLWLVAHLDSKSQPVPIAFRAAGIAASALVWIAAFAVAGAQVMGADAAAAWPWIGSIGGLAGVPVAASVVGTRSPGALDNASGVATVLLAAAEVPAAQPLGVLLTSAEELGLAGARAWVRRRPAAVAINCDGVDDRGAITLMYSGRRRPDALVRAGEHAGASAGVPVRVRRLLPGILTDGVALADAGWEVITVSKGTVSTLARIHTRGDRADRLSGAGVAEAARFVAAMAAARITGEGG
jgi:hypothetical protein